MKQSIKDLSDKELLELEHDTEVDLINYIPGDCGSVTNYLKLFRKHEKLLKIIKKRNLTKLPRLNSFL